MITIFNPISKFYNKILQKGYDLGYTKGIKDGQKDADDRIDKYSNLFDKVFNSKELEIKELKAKLEEKPKESATTHTPWTNDETMLWLNSMAEIIETKYFNTTLWSNTKANGIKEVIEYIDYLEHTFEIKTTYPQTYSLLPELRKAIGKVYDNKLAVEEAEKLF